MRLAMRYSVAVVLVWILLPGSVISAQRGAYTAATDLNQMVAQAQTILRGHVVSANVEPHPQFSELQTVVVTLKVDRVLKGTAATTYTFRQYIWDARDATDAAGYRKAGELLLFLNPISSNGLTSPVGMEQGRFRVERDASGNGSALNGQGNVGLFTGVTGKASARGITLSARARAMLNQGSGRASLVTLEETIQALAGAAK